MKRINELKEKRAQLIEQLTQITTSAETEKRMKNSDELVQWNNLKGTIEEMNSEIETLETEERFNLNFVKKEVEKNVETKENKEVRNYNVTKAINQFINGKLDGLELELHQEGVNQMRSFSRTATGLVIPDVVKRSFTAAGFGATHFEKVQEFNNGAVEGGILEKLGVTVYNNATASIGLNFSAGISAGIYAEGEEAPESTYAEKSGILSPKRIQGWKNFSRSYLAQTATTQDFLMSMEAAIQKAVSEDMIKKILGTADLILTGRDSVAAGAPIVWKDFMKLQAAVQLDEVTNPKFLVGKSLFHELKAIAKDAGSGRFLSEGDLVDGVALVNAGTKMPVTGTTTLKHQLIYGDFKEAYVAYFNSGTEVLVDPYSGSNAGKVKVSFIRMGSTEVNPYAFKTIQNITI